MNFQKFTAFSSLILNERIGEHSPFREPTCVLVTDSAEVAYALGTAGGGIFLVGRRLGSWRLVEMVGIKTSRSQSAQGQY